MTHKSPISPSTVEDQTFMAQALAMAKRAYGRTSPNPMVGSVVVREGQVVATGYHRRAGLDHAEVAAVKDAERRGVDLRGTTLYVNLEPCSFQGRTPPCTEVCARVEFARVVIGTTDPNPRVDGRGVAALKAAGIEVQVGILEDQCRALNAPFFTRMLKGRPHVTVKVAMSLDGKIATHTGESFPLTGAEARTRVHQLRDRMDAILVGRTTAERDDPQLTCRLPPELAGAGGPRDPTRIVIDPGLSLSPDLKLFRLHAEGHSAAKTWLVAADDVSGRRDHLARLDALGVEVIRSPRQGDGRLDVSDLFRQLGARDIGSVLVEGGGDTIASLVEARLVDAWIAHVAPALVGGVSAPSPFGGAGFERLSDRLMLRKLTTRHLGGDVELAASVEGDVYGLD